MAVDAAIGAADLLGLGATDAGVAAATDVAATTAADVAGATAADVAGTAGVTGLDLGGAGTVAGMSTAEQLGQAGLVSGLDLGGSGAVAGMTAAEQTAASSLPSLAQILGVAKTAAPIIGGLGQVAGGVGSLLAGQRMGQLAGQADPFGPYRPQYASQLSELMQNPQTVTTTPGYQFNLAQGLQAMQAQQAAQGRLVSGGALLQGQQFGQQLAGQTYNQQLATLASLSGATQSPATGTGATANLLGGQLGGQLGGAQAIAAGLGTATGTPINPLYSLYSGYNQPTPSPTA
jgi:hypothetical protein